MFTGIVEEIGKIKNIFSKGSSKALLLDARKIQEDTRIGDSISVNGVCLTVNEKKSDGLVFDVIEETLERTNLRFLKKGDSVNVEGALASGGKVSGHFVYGHIDGLRPVVGGKKGKDGGYVDIALNKEDHKYVLEKGSIAVDGVSLTVGKVFSDKVRIFLIPHTLKNTILPDTKTGDRVNIEFDFLAKYVYKQSRGGITEKFLKETGFKE